jgi:class 3 adenylate cyclase
LFSDLVESTQLLAGLGEAAFDEFRRRHFGILRAAIGDHHGQEIKTTGDGILAVFGSAADALSCAVAMQQAIDCQAWQGQSRVAIRVGLAHGDVVFEDRDVFGIPVVQAARLTAAARTGQILATAVVAAVAGGRARTTCTELGPMTLKGLPDPVAVCEVAWEPPAQPVEPVATVTGVQFRELGSGLPVARASAFVGRKVELADLIAQLEGALTGRGTAAFIAGDPGIGKTRLASEIARLAVERGAEAHWGRCWESGGAPPFWPWVEILRSMLTSRESATLPRGTGVLARLVPELSPHGGEPSGDPPGAAATDRFLLLDALAITLTTWARRSPVVLVLDDLQWADQSSIQALCHLSRMAPQSALLIIATARARDAAERADLGEFERAAARIDLHGLGDDEVAELFTAAVGRNVEGALLDRVQRVCGGNPFLVHAVATSARTGALEVPASVRAFVRRQMEPLTSTARKLIEIAAVLGRELSLTRLGAITGLAPEALLDSLGEIERAGILRPLDARYTHHAFVHDLVQETISSDLPPRRRAQLHAHIGAALEQLYGGLPEAHTAELAHHALASLALGGADRALDLARRAGDHARRQFAYDEAARWYRQAWEVAVLMPSPPPSLRAELLLAEGAALRATLAADAGDVLYRAAEEARALGNADLLARIVVTWGHRHGGATLFDERLFPLVSLSLDWLPSTDSPLRARLLGFAAVAKARRGAPDAAQGAREAQAMAQRTGDARAQLDALHALHAVHQVTGDLSTREAEARIRLGGRLEEAAQALADPDALADALYLRAASALVIGDVASVEHDLATLLNPPFGHTELTRSIAAPFRCALAGLRNDVARFEAALAEGRDIWSRRDIGEHGLLVSRMCHAHVLGRDDPLLAFPAPIVETEATPEARLYARGYEAALRCAEAALLAQRGDVTVIKAISRDPPRRLYRSPAAGTRMAVAFLAEACADTGELKLAPDAYAWLAPASGNLLFTNHAGWVVMGSVDHYLGVLATALGDYAAAERHLASALALEERLGGPQLAARTCYRWARLARARAATGDAELANRHLTACLQLCRRHQMAHLARRAEALSAEEGGESTAVEGSPPGSRHSVFRRDGEFWTVVFEGKTVRLKHSKGMAYLALLLARPGHESHAAEIVGAGVVDATDAGPALDEHAKRAYRSRLTVLAADLDEAQRYHDPVRAERAQAEIDAITDELTTAVGIGGRDRRVGSASERARVAATRGIRSALDRISGSHPALGQHLHVAIRTGTYCAYEPDPRAPVEWITT